MGVLEGVWLAGARSSSCWSQVLVKVRTLLQNWFARSLTLESRGAPPLHEGGHALAGAGKRESGRREGGAA